MGNFNLADYEPVHERLPKFWALHPKGQIKTDMTAHSTDYQFVVFKCELYDNDKNLIATGWAYEQAGKGYVNATSHIENAETSAIGRALANMGLSGDKRPSREEMQKAERQAPMKPVDDLPAGPSHTAEAVDMTPKVHKLTDRELAKKLKEAGATAATVQKLMHKFGGDEVALKNAGEFLSYDLSAMME